MFHSSKIMEMQQWCLKWKMMSSKHPLNESISKIKQIKNEKREEKKISLIWTIRFHFKKITFNNLKLEAYNTFSKRMNDLKRKHKNWENDIMYNVFTSIDYYGSLFFFLFYFYFFFFIFVVFFNCRDFCLRSSPTYGRFRYSFAK